VSTLAERLAAVRAALPAEVTLVAVSKTQPAEAIREAFAAGQRDFGENYAQEWREKADALADLAGLRWHFIGGLQTNKVKYLAGRVHAIHTVDREELAREISRRFGQKGATARVFLEVNVGGEASKGGCAPADVARLAAAVRALPAVELGGLTCIPPPGEDPRPHFRALRALAEGLGLRELSMGMSADWPVAVAEGATVVRVGTAIFGERPRRP
jgi:pyridoxal phosphate enzyme (YggS family)